MDDSQRITSPIDSSEHLTRILPKLQRTPSDPRPVVLMTCGISGAGKSTLSKTIISALPCFQRFSIDVYIYNKHGRYGADYPKSKYEDYQIEAKEALTLQLRELLRTKDRDAILDFSFAFKEVRDEYKTLIEQEGGRWVLAYLDVDGETLRQRIRKRREGVVDADSAFEVTEEVLARYLEGFQRPENEGEIVLRIA